MSELLNDTKRELWYDGPNYTADAVIIDPAAANILLIKRKDTGDWALPGGFIDKTDSSGYHAAIREAEEEASMRVGGYAPRIFKGIVDDPRNSEHAWIETEAFLFHASSEIPVNGKDDATDAQWHSLASLPPLYASHQAILERALDTLDGQNLVEAFTMPDAFTRVDGGHMEYEKYIFEKDGQAVFCKQHREENFSDIEKSEHSFLYLQKEASILSHLRIHNFPAIPYQSTLHVDALAMTALSPNNGWCWKANEDSLQSYINDAFRTFEQLEQVTPPLDTFPIEASYATFRREGWQAIDTSTREKLSSRFFDFAPRLHDQTRQSAHALFDDLRQLQQDAHLPHSPENLVFCHHDIRQSNIAWHPDYATKLVDWSWAGYGEPGSDITSLLIDLHKSGHDISPHLHRINPHHCLTLIGFWLAHSTWPYRGDDTVRFQQFTSAVSAYELYTLLSR